MIGGKFVINPPARESHAHRHGAGQVSKRLVKIRAVLLRDLINRAFVQMCAVAFGQRIHVADHGARHISRRQTLRRTAVRRDQNRRM